MFVLYDFGQRPAHPIVGVRGAAAVGIGGSPELAARGVREFGDDVGIGSAGLGGLLSDEPGGIVGIGCDSLRLYCLASPALTFETDLQFPALLFLSQDDLRWKSTS